MQMLWTILGTLSIGSLLTIAVSHFLARRSESRRDRRTLYVELLTLLSSRRAYMQSAVLDPDATVAELPPERIDKLNALLLVDATETVRKQAKACFELLNRFGLTRSLRVPVEIDEHGLYSHRFEQVTDQPAETRDMLVRISLGKVADDFGAAVDVLAAQMRREIHR